MKKGRSTEVQTGDISKSRGAIMPKLALKTLSLRNFRSYPDEPTVVQLDKIGMVLIVGQKDNDETKSNGSGKTSLVDAIIWCLFGRLSNKDRPSDWVINFFVKKDCVVKIITCDGYVVERTRNLDGKDDLLLQDPTGKDISLSTNIATQQLLNKLFDLDYDIFVNSVFFTQSGLSFMELPDQKRKKALERMLSLTRFDYYSQVAKDKITKVQEILLKSTVGLERLDVEILRISKQIEENNNSIADYEGQRTSRITSVQQKPQELDRQYKLEAKNINEKIEKAKFELAKIHLYDLDQLKKKWEIYNKITIKLNEEKQKIAKLGDEVSRLEAEKETLSKTSTQNFEDQIKHTAAQLEALNQELSQMIEHNLTKLLTEWEAYEVGEETIKRLTIEKYGVMQEVAKHGADEKLLQEEVLKWRNRIGTICPECHQPVNEEHVKKETNPYMFKFKKAKDSKDARSEKLEVLAKQLEDFQKQHIAPKITVEKAEDINAKRGEKIAQINSMVAHLDEIKKKQEEVVNEANRVVARLKEIDLLIPGKNAAIVERNAILNNNITKTEENKPKVSIVEAKSIKGQYDAKQNEISSYEEALVGLSEDYEKDKNAVVEEIEKIKIEVNPYQNIMDKLLIDLNKIKEERKQLSAKIGDLNKLERHLAYIQHVYSDRRCIKSFVLSELVPFFNERIKYYLDTFECETLFEFNSFLQIKNDKWPYELWSGGEKKRIDVAIMLAIHDLHESIYEKQCNIIIFDEVDGKLDVNGVNLFVNLLQKDFSGSNVLVISHKDQMKDMFPTKILIKNIDKMSYLEEVR